jgi:hypothetical protein
MSEQISRDQIDVLIALDRASSPLSEAQLRQASYATDLPIALYRLLRAELITIPTVGFFALTVDGFTALATVRSYLRPGDR